MRRSAGQQKKMNSRASLTALYAAPPRSRPPCHRFGPGKAPLPLRHSEPRRPPRVKPGAHRGPRLPARQCWCLYCGALSVNFSLVAKIAPLEFSFATKTTLVDSYISCPTSHQGARQSPFMLPSCLDGHATSMPRKRRPRSVQPPLYPPAPADTRDCAGLARGAVLWVHASTQNIFFRENKRRKEALASMYYY